MGLNEQFQHKSLEYKAYYQTIYTVCTPVVSKIQIILTMFSLLEFYKLSISLQM